MSIAFDAASSGFSSGAQTSLTFSHTCTGSDRILTVMVSTDGGTTDVVNFVTYAGVGLTKVDDSAISSANANMSSWYLIAPATGANDIQISVSPARQIYGIGLSHTGAKQSAQPDANGKTTNDATTPYSVSTTTVADNCWIVAYVRGGTQLTPSTNVVQRSSPFDTIKGGDTNAAITPPGATTQAWAELGTDAATSLLTLSIAPLAADAGKRPRNLTLLGVT